MAVEAEKVLRKNTTEKIELIKAFDYIFKTAITASGDVMKLFEEYRTIAARRHFPDVEAVQALRVKPPSTSKTGIPFFLLKDDQPQAG